MGHVLPAAALERIPDLCRQYHVRRLDVFGSAADGRFDPAGSDIDLLVTLEPMQPVAYSKAHMGLHEALIQLFGRDVDLVTERSIINPYFRRQVETQRVPLFASP